MVYDFRLDGADTPIYNTRLSKSDMVSAMDTRNLVSALIQNPTGLLVGMILIAALVTPNRADGESEGGMLGTEFGAGREDPVRNPSFEEAPLVPEHIEFEGGAQRSAVWRIKAADGALKSGLSAIAARLYGRVLDSGELRGEEGEQVALNTCSALISEGEFEEAAKIIEKYTGSTNPAFRMRRALLFYQTGDLKAASDILKGLTVDELKSGDQAWFYLLTGLVHESRQDPIKAERQYELAIGASVSETQRAHFDAILYRSRLLFLLPGQLHPNLVTDLRAKLKSSRGRFEGFQNAKVLAVVLHELGETEEAIAVIEEQLGIEAVKEGDLQDELLLLLGLIAGEETQRGKGAFARLLSNDGNREFQKIALRILGQLVLTIGQRKQIEELLDDLVERPTAHSLLDELYFFRAFLRLQNGRLGASEADAKRILSEYPGSPFAERAIYLLAYLSWLRDPPQFRSAADYLNQLRGRLEKTTEKAGLSVLVADCYFLNGDYEQAAEAYETALWEAEDEETRGVLFFQRVTSEIETGRLERAAAYLDATEFGSGIRPVDRWRAEWNLISRMKESGGVGLAFTRIQELLSGSKLFEIPPELQVRLMWLEAQLSLEANEPEKTPAMVAQILTALARVPDSEIGTGQREQIISHSLLLHGRAFFALEREDEGLRIFEELRSIYPDSRPSILSYAFEARHHSAMNHLAKAQQRFIALADEFPESEYAGIALWEAAEIASQRDQKEEAGRILQDLVEHYPEHELIFYARLRQGDLSRELDDFATAQSLYESLINHFFDHPERFRAEISLADCFLAQSGMNPGRLGDAVAILERLVDLPNIPLDLRLEAGYKWGFALGKMDRSPRAQEAYWLVLDRFLRGKRGSDETGARGRYWLARSIFDLGELLEEDRRFEEARRVYAYVSAYGLPGESTAEARVKRFSAPGL